MPIELFVNGTLMRGLELHGNLEGTEFCERPRLLRHIAPSSLLVSRRNWVGAIEIGSGLVRLNRNASTSLPSRAAVAWVSVSPLCSWPLAPSSRGRKTRRRPCARIANSRSPRF